MSAEVVGRYMPAVATLDDLSAMITADPHGHRYEISPEGVLSVMPPPDYEQAVVATRLTLWLSGAGWPAEQVTQAVGLRIPGSRGTVGGRVPDLVVWAQPQPLTRIVWQPTDDVLLVIEVIAPGCDAADRITKLREYERAGIPRYWIVDRDAAQTVTVFELAGRGYQVTATTPLAWVLKTAPEEQQIRR
jgi:Uma2 family endonuclease